MSLLADKQRSQRQHAAAPGSGHDRLVRALRVVLPAVIGILLALLVFSPFTNTLELSFLLDKDEVNVAPERMRVNKALYRGADNKGRAFTLEAGSAVQKSSLDPTIRLRNLNAQIQLDEGPASVTAENGLYDLQDQSVRVTGPLSVKSADGYSVVANDVALGLKDQIVRGTGQINVSSAKGYSSTARNANFSLQSQIMTTPEQLEFSDTNGFSILANGVSANLRSRQIIASGPVNGRTKVGTFSGNSMNADLINRVIIIKGNVKLRIDQNAIR
jgi:lipopolysaccharide export system protein LptC